MLCMCLNASKVGLTCACWPVVGIDECFLKGRYGGVLLIAIGIDANNNRFSIAFACVQSESGET